jgi:nitrogen-specific signal transduction histidine kinase
MSLPNPTDVRAIRRRPADPILRERDERLESLKAVTGKLAHDFNNFLAPTYGYLTLLKDEVASNSTAALYVKAMDSAAQKAEAHISSILLGMRPYRQFSPREFRLDQLLQELLDRSKAETPAGTELSILARLDPFPFCGDERQWHVLIEQLLSNARYALAMGGQLEVTLERQALPGSEVQRLGLGTDDVFSLRVRDNGFGMNSEVVRRAFEPFFTTRTQVKAAGMGLTVVHGVALYHGGQVELESAEDRGTAVTVWIPARGFRAEDRISATSSHAVRPKLRRRVLLIVDDPLIKEVLRDWLAIHDLETETAADEAEAGRLLQRAGAHCALVISETDLKSGRGEDLFQNLGQLNQAAPWVFLVSQRTPVFSQVTGREEPLLMKKPFSHNAFSALVQRYANR